MARDGAAVDFDKIDVVFSGGKFLSFFKTFTFFVKNKLMQISTKLLFMMIGGSYVLLPSTLRRFI